MSHQPKKDTETMEFVAALKNSNWTLAAAAAAATGATVLLAAYQRPKRNNLKVKKYVVRRACESPLRTPRQAPCFRKRV